MIQYGTIKRIGANRVDVQLAGSAATLSSVEVSAQVSWDLLAVGTRVLVDMVNSRPVVLHTLADNPLFYTPQAQTYDGIVQNALLADGSVPLTGNLPVTPGVTIDGYDISVLGQAVVNLQAADTIARTGYTVMTHATHLVETIDADATEIVVRDNILATNEQLVVSNTSGQIEWMRATDAGTATLDDDGALCYRYTVTRRVDTNPGGLYTGWAAATLVNGGTFRGFIAFDNRHNASGSPSMRFVTWTDSPPTNVEHVVRMGNMNGILGLGSTDYGFAVGKLTTADKYIAYNTTTDDLHLHNASLAVTDAAGSEVFRVYSRYEAGHAPGDLVAGMAGGAQWNVLPEAGEINLSNLAGKVLWFTPTESRIGGLLSVGDSPGPQVQLGMLNGAAFIAARNLAGVAQFLVETNPATGNVHVFQGNPKPQGNWTEFENGVLTVDGTIRARDGVFLGTLSFASTGRIVIQSPDDPQRYGEILPHGQIGRTTRADGSQYPSMVLAWAPLVVQTAPGINKTFLAGDMLLGDPVYSNFQVKRSGMMGMFWGDDPKSYLDAAGNAVHDGLVYAQGGEFTGSVIIRDGGSLIFGDNNRLDHEGIKLNATYSAGPGYANSLTWLDAASPSVTAARIFSHQGLATNYLVLEATDANSNAATDADVSLTAYGGVGRQGVVRLSASGGGHVPSELRVQQDSSGNGTVVIDNAVFVPYSDGTGAIQMRDAAGSSTILNIDTTNKRVGIGTATPGAPLHIYGSGNMNQWFESSAGRANIAIYSAANKFARFIMCQGGSLTGGNYSGDSRFDVGLGEDSTGNFYIGSMDLASKWLSITPGGNVGIGVDTGTQKLDVAGYGKFSSGLIAPVLQPDGNSTTALQIQTAGSVALVNFDTTNQRVGIGNTSPSTQMDVYGGIRAQGRASSENVPSAGSGIEIGYYSDLSYGQILAYDRTGSAYLPIQLSGSEIKLNVNGSEIAKVTSTGMVFSSVRPASDSATAIQVQTAGGTALATFDTANSKLKVSTTHLGFYGADPVTQPGSYTTTNVSSNRAFNANSTSLDELADVLGTLIADLTSLGLLGSSSE